MTLTRRRSLAVMGAAAMVAPTRIAANGVHEVQMLNTHPEKPTELMVFYPDIVRIAPGETVRFLSVDTNHNSAAHKDMLPEGAERWKSPIGKDFELTLDVEGAYGYVCTPHTSYGMVGLILVGDVSGNYESLKGVRQRGKGKARFQDIFARADEMLAAEAS